MRPHPRDFSSKEAFDAAIAEWVATPEGAEAERVRKQNDAWRLRNEAQTRARTLQIPPRDFEIIQSGAVVETAAMKALTGKELVVCLSGNSGCGKTTAAASALFAEGSGLFVKAARLSRWDRYDNDEMNRLLRTHLLVIDDLGMEYQDAKGNFLAILDEVIDHRYDHRRRTVLTTNLDAEQFKERYGERIADRIRESGKFVSLAGDSMRRKPAVADYLKGPNDAAR